MPETQQTAGSCGVSAKPRTFREELVDRKQVLLDQVKEIDAALFAMDANPGVLELCQLLAARRWM